MNLKNSSKYLCSLLSLFFAINSSASEITKVWVDRLACGNAKYEIHSSCVKAEDDMSLNKCEPQTLKIVSSKVSTKVQRLPHLNEYDKRTIKEAGGEIESLFVTKWACGKNDKVSVAVFYYSTGGGSASYSEATSSYDESGAILQKDKIARYKKAFQDGFKHLTTVHSIMPD